MDTFLASGVRGIGLIVTVEVNVAATQPPLAAMLLVIMYVPGVLSSRSISPVLVLAKTRAGDEVENNPALPPGGKLGSGLVPPGQYGPL